MTARPGRIRARYVLMRTGAVFTVPYRFLYLIQKALEFTNDLRNLGTSLLSAYEKGDAEYLSSLHSGQEYQMISRSLVIRQNQWREADWQVQALKKTKEGAIARQEYYKRLIQNGLNNLEIDYQMLVEASKSYRATGNVSEGIAQSMSYIPDFFVGFPCTFSQIPIGTKLGGVFTAVARISQYHGRYQKF